VLDEVPSGGGVQEGVERGRKRRATLAQPVPRGPEDSALGEDGFLVVEGIILET
jgi:hypothetical protein